ncbi:MAG TPA: hypothetical protein VF148_04655 [Acidimicrobiia bacterium]
MTSVVVAPHKVVSFPEGGGHFWVYMQYVLGLRQLGLDVYWLEQLLPGEKALRDPATVRVFADRMTRFGLEDRFILYSSDDQEVEFRHGAVESAEDILGNADLLLNFHYAAQPPILNRFRRAALVDIDPGLLQFWMSRGQLTVQPHDLYFTIGETVGKERDCFPDVDVHWLPTRPVVSLDDWPVHYVGNPAPFTSISTWATDSWVVDGDISYENSKRISYRRFAELPSHTSQDMELALYMIGKDDAEREWMERLGWRIRLSTEVAADPDGYRSYIQSSRGEYSVAKPAYVSFQTAWVSDRSVCYLASGKPVVVQDTGPSEYLPENEGMFRFETVEQAARAIETINDDYPGQCRTARQIAEDFFDSRVVLTDLLERALA